MNLETLAPTDLAKFAANAIQSYADRDDAITRAGTIRSQAWNPPVPEAWRATTKPRHSSLGKNLPIVAVGTCTMNEPTYGRTPPDDDIGVVEKADAVERHLQARFAYDKRRAIAGQSMWIWSMDQICNYGGICASSVFAPHAYADSPPMRQADGKYRRELWRDSRGKPTDDEKDIDDEAVARAYVKDTEEFRRRAEPPIVHRFIPVSQCYPVFTASAMVAMVVRRKMSALELSMAGFTGPEFEGDKAIGFEKQHEVTELWTPNRVRYFLKDQPLRHDVYGEDGIYTGYGFVPFSYRIGFPPDSPDGAIWGNPLLQLVASNIIEIDWIMTVRHNAAMLAGFPTWVAEDEGKIDPAALAAGANQLQHLEIQIGKVNYFPGRKIVGLQHPGLNKDFDRMLADERTEIRRIIPDVLVGQAESSGYNSALMTQQARSFFNPVIEGAEAFLEDMAVMDMLHIYHRLPGPIYLEYAHRADSFGIAPKKMSRIKIDRADVGGYFGVDVEISRIVDRITLASWAAELYAAGHGYEDFVLDAMGIKDTEQAKAKRLMDDFYKSPQVQEVLTQRIIERFGLQDILADSQAASRIQTGLDGTPLVSLPSGALAGPGQPPQLPEQQGMAGAVMGGMNLASTGPNMASTNNPTIGVPTPQQPMPARRRGGAIPGKPQRQGWRKTIG